MPGRSQLLGPKTILICATKANFVAWQKKKAATRMLPGMRDGCPCDIPSGEHTKSNGKWPFIVDFPIKNGDFPWQNVSSPEGTHHNMTCDNYYHQQYITIYNNMMNISKSRSILDG